MNRIACPLAFAVLLAGACQSGATGPLRIIVDQPSALMDAPLAIQVDGAQSGARVVVQARAESSPGTTWTSCAAFTADAQGRVDLRSARPSAGSSYAAPDSMGPIWSLTTPDSSATVTPPDVPPDPERVTLSASSGGASASRELTRLTMSPDVMERRLTVAGDGLYGRFYSPPAQGAGHAAVLVFGGSEGGLGYYVALEASLLASHGYPTLALAYFNEPGLPPTLQNVPLDYFVSALSWLGRQPGVDSRHLTVIGASRGTEAALLLGAHFPQLVRAVAEYSPSSVVNPGLAPSGADGSAWTLGGQPVPRIALYELGDPSPASDAQAIIPVEDILGPVFLVSGASDSLWPSPRYAAAITARLDAHHDRFSHQSLVYPGAGHGVLAAVPYGPAQQIQVRTQYGELDMGGSAAANERGMADSWPKLLRFLAAAAGGS
jgi:dienelactone hydrolase